MDEEQSTWFISTGPKKNCLIPGPKNFHPNLADPEKYYCLHFRLNWISQINVGFRTFPSKKHEQHLKLLLDVFVAMTKALIAKCWWSDKIPERRMRDGCENCLFLFTFGLVYQEMFVP
jgi:hypothetical protein